MISIRDVALKAGVAPSTVSFVLNDRQCVAPDTKARVLDVLKELKYVHRKSGRPVRMSAAPRETPRKGLVAFLFPYSATEIRRISVYMTAIHAMEMAFTARGTNVIIRHVVPGMALDVDNLASKIDGAIFVQSEKKIPLRSLVSNRPSVRVFGIVSESEPWDHVTYDNRIIGKLAADYLLSKGHRACAFLAPHAGISFSHALLSAQFDRERQQVFSDTIAAAGGTVHVNTAGVAKWLPDSPQAFTKILSELLQRRPAPTALFIPADGLTFMAYSIMHSLGIRPGVDIEIITCNNEPEIISNLHPRPVVIDIHADVIGELAVQQLEARMRRSTLPRVVSLVRPTLILPDSQDDE